MSVNVTHCSRAEPAECNSNMMFKCASGGGACVPWEYYCDGHADCADASDEQACRHATADPERATTAPPAVTPAHHRSLSH